VISDQLLVTPYAPDAGAAGGECTGRTLPVSGAAHLL